MEIAKLDHVNVRTTQLDTMIKWYTDILGLRSGKRPNLSFDGAWMYAGEAAVVHLVRIDGSPAIGAEVSLKLEHFSFKATGAAEFEKKLQGTGEQFKLIDLPEINLVLYNVWDPDGNHIHVDFPADELTES